MRVEIAHAMKRNKEIFRQRHALAGVARCTGDAGFRSLAEASFRKKLFVFSLPPHCKFWPKELASAQRAHEPKDQSAVPAAVARTLAWPRAFNWSSRDLSTFGG